MKKQDTFYFDNFKDCAEYSLKAANLLDEIMNNYSKDTIKSYVDKMHEIEHSGDKKKHEMLEVLLKAFMTPMKLVRSNMIMSKPETIVKPATDTINARITQTLTSSKLSHAKICG